MAYATIEKHRAYHAKYGRELRERLREEEKCTSCGRTPIPGKNWCYRCSFRCAVNNKGLSQEEKNKAWKLFEHFDGKCQCCGTTNFGKRRPHLDHKDGKVRGIICGRCNVALGYLRDNSDIAFLAAGYLKKHGY